MQLHTHIHRPVYLRLRHHHVLVNLKSLQPFRSRLLTSQTALLLLAHETLLWHLIFALVLWVWWEVRDLHALALVGVGVFALLSV